MLFDVINVFVGDDVVFLDPHVTQNFIDFEDEEQFSDETYHPETCSRINFQSMDPSLALVRLLRCHILYFYYRWIINIFFSSSAFHVRRVLNG